MHKGLSLQGEIVRKPLLTFDLFGERSADAKKDRFFHSLGNQRPGPIAISD
jgi:hypothetical protein